MEFYEAKNDMKRDGSWLLGELQTPDGQEAQRWAFRYGVPVEWHGALSAEIILAGRPLDLNFNTFNTFIVSATAREIIDQFAPTAIQYFPVDIVGAPQPYFIANIIEQVDCLDEELSHVERFQPNDPVRPDRAGEISLVIDLHIDAERAAGHHLFRLKGYDSATIVSEDLKMTLEKAGMTGLKYDHVTSPNIADFRIKFAEKMRRRAATGT